MRTYFELIEAVSSSRRTTRKATAKPTPTTEAYPWWRPHTGWWHPSGKQMTFVSNERDNHHITQVFKNPSFFGLTKDSILSLIEKDKQIDRRAADEEYLDYLMGVIDTDWSLEEKMVLSKGWVRTRLMPPRGGKIALLIGGYREYLRKAVGVASLHSNGGFIFADEHDTTPNKMVSLYTMEEMERYYKGRV